MRRLGTGCFAAVASLALLHASGACSSSPGDTGAVDAAVRDGDPYPREAGDAPSSSEDAPLVIDGWEQWNDYSPMCSFSIRANGSPLPPLVWEPCAPATGSSQTGCRQIKFTWGHPRHFGGDFITGATRAFVHDDGRVALQTSREENGDIIRTIVDVDGAVLQAFRERSDGCTLTEMPSFGEHYVYKINDTVAKGKLTGYGGGALGGALSERPRVLLRFPDQIDRGFAAGTPGVLDTNAMELHAWKDGALIASVNSPDDISLAASEFTFVGNTLFWSAGSLSISRQKVWSPSAGTSSLLTAGNDATHGYGDLATDGVQMVWSEGVRMDVSRAYPQLSIVTSPYATDAESLVPRVLRSDIAGSGFGIGPWVVGCGYAARHVTLEPSPGNYTTAAFVVRLTDGTAWKLPDGPKEPFGWRRPLAITCDELFALVASQESGSFNVARIRLDALGPGIPPP